MCMVGGHAWWEGACVAEGGYAWQGGGHAWQVGMCGRGMHSGGACMAGVCMVGGACMAGGHVWQEGVHGREGACVAYGQ